MAKREYAFQKEGDGYSIWTMGLSGSRQDFVDSARTKREAQRKVDKLYARDEDAERAARTKTHHATKKPRIGYFIRSQGPGGVEFDEVYVYGPTSRSDEGMVGHDLRVRPTRLGPGTYTSVVSPDDVEWTKPRGHQPTTQEIKQDVDRILADAARRK